ncbi:MAG: hypothetical protein ACOY93_18980 [Bacillota bacterium]
MYTLGSLLVAWVLGFLVIQRGALKEVLPAILCGMLLVGLPAAIPGVDLPYGPVDPDLGPNPWVARLLTQVGITPVFTAWFAQGVPKGGPFPLRRITLFALLGLGLELMRHGAGLMQYAPWWGPHLSFPLYLGFLFLIYLAHAYTPAFGSPHQRGDRSVREVTSTHVLPSSGGSHMARGPLDR